jgi:hypothetical protein
MIDRELRQVVGGLLIARKINKVVRLSAADIYAIEPYKQWQNIYTRSEVFMMQISSLNLAQGLAGFADNFVEIRRGCYINKHYVNAIEVAPGKSPNSALVKIFVLQSGQKFHASRRLATDAKAACGFAHANKSK